MINIKNYFSSNLKHLRTQKGLTQSELAAKLDKDYSTIGKWELGERNPTTLDLFKIADIFNISERDLVNKNIIVDNEKEEIDFMKQYKILFDKDDKLDDIQKTFLINFLEEQHKKIDEEVFHEKE